MAESQRQTIINLYNSGILPEIIAFQLDITAQDVDKVIQSINRTDIPAKQEPDATVLASFYLDAVVDLDRQSRWLSRESGRRLRLNLSSTSLLKKHMKFFPSTPSQRLCL